MSRQPEPGVTGPIGIENWGLGTHQMSGPFSATCTPPLVDRSPTRPELLSSFGRSGKMRLGFIVVAGALAACGAPPPTTTPAPVRSAPTAGATPTASPGMHGAEPAKREATSVPGLGGRQEGTVRYRCQGGSSVTATYDSTGMATIRWNGRVHALRRSATTDGLAYGNSTYTWVADDDRFELKERGQSVASDCSSQ